MNGTIPSFLALDLEEWPSERREDLAQGLTPQLMQWTETLWILDLRSCARYWAFQTRKRGRTFLSLVDHWLRQQRVASAEDSEEPGAPRGACADHPWRALLLVETLRERGLGGLVSRRSAFGERLYRQMTWETWQRTAHTASVHAAMTHRRGRRDGFSKSWRRLQKAMARLGVAAPAELHGMSAAAMRRRFGDEIRQYWEWTFPPESEDGEGDEAGEAEAPLFARSRDSGVFDDGFPWISWRREDPPSVVRHLDEPAWDWAVLESFLREDFDRLCRDPALRSGDRVLQLQWRIICHDMTQLPVVVEFRHPHPLHGERGDHGTARLQAYYAFERARASEAGEATEEEEGFPAVVSWELVVSEKLAPAWIHEGLFDTTQEGEAALLRLENKLPIALEGFRPTEDWCPEDSFRRTDEAFSPEEDLARSRLCLSEAGRKRPLFLYPEPLPLKEEPSADEVRFTERTMAKWWGSRPPGEPRVLQKDYYRMLDREGRWFWVGRDSAGRWYRHGVFG